MGSRGQHGHMSSKRSAAEGSEAQLRTHDDAGVDLTQIDMMLAMTPLERLRFLYETASSLARLMPDADAD
jgi:hypothetical protein